MIENKTLQPHIVRADENQKLAFRKTFRLSIRDPRSESWEGLHEMRREITDAMDGTLKRVERDKRDLSESEQAAMEIGSEYLDSIKTEFENRDKSGQKGPVDYSFKGEIPSMGTLSGTERKAAMLTQETRKYREMFPEANSRNEFRDFNDFVETLTSGRHDPRLEKRTFVEGSGVLGGFDVPVEYSEILLDKSLETEIVRSRATIFPMQSRTRQIPAWDNSDHSTSVFGGFTGQWLAEGQEGDVQTGRLRSMTLNARTLAIYSELSLEIAEDGLSLGSQLAQALPKAVGYFLDAAFLRGNGVGRPQGVINAPSAVAVTRDTGSSIKLPDLKNMYGRLHPACHDNAVFLCNYRVLPYLIEMKDDSSALVWTAVHAGGIAAPLPQKIYGKPVIFTEKLPSLGVTGDMVLCDLSQYAVGLRKEILLEQSNAPGWTRRTLSYRCLLRADGMSLWDDAVTPADGSTNTLTWCVTLSSST